MKTLFETMNEEKTISMTPSIIAAKVEQYKNAERLRNSLPTDKHGVILDEYDVDNRRYWNMATQALAFIIADAIKSQRVYGSPLGNVKVYKGGEEKRSNGFGVLCAGFGRDKRNDGRCRISVYYRINV